jgi:hypothetical protein
MLRAASSDKNCPHCKSKDAKLATANTKKANANQKAL